MQEEIDQLRSMLKAEKERADNLQIRIDDAMAYVKMAQRSEVTEIERKTLALVEHYLMGG